MTTLLEQTLWVCSEVKVPQSLDSPRSCIYTYGNTQLQGSHYSTMANALCPKRVRPLTEARQVCTCLTSLGSSGVPFSLILPGNPEQRRFKATSKRLESCLSVFKLCEVCLSLCVLNLVGRGEEGTTLVKWVSVCMVYPCGASLWSTSSQFNWLSQLSLRLLLAACHLVPTALLTIRSRTI